jgi:hypothetical protein
MNRAGSKDAQRRRLLAVILGASLLAGCQPEGTGSITMDRKAPALHDLKTFEDVKVSKTAKTNKKPAGTNSGPRAGFR